MMACVAQFGIINKFDEIKNYSKYEPEKYDCIAINDDIINDWWNELTFIKTYFHNYNRPSFALARWGVTLIPPESLGAFYNIVSKYAKSNPSTELDALMKLLIKSISDNKYVIHYGV